MTSTRADTYRSPAARPSWPARAWPTAVFYLRVAWIVLLAAHRSGRGKPGLGILNASQAVMRSLEAVGGAFTIENLDVLRSLGSPCVFVANHMSILEAFVLPGLIQPHCPVTFVVKRSLAAYPVFRHALQSMDPIMVDRRNARTDLRAVLHEGARRLETGVSVVLFPQTTRSLAFDPRRFNSLGVKLAAHAGVPLVPVALKTDAWGLGRRLKDFGKIDPSKRVYIRFGSPLTISGDAKHVHRQVLTFIADAVSAWR